MDAAPLFVVERSAGHRRRSFEAPATEARKLLNELLVKRFDGRAPQETSFDLVGQCADHRKLLPSCCEPKLTHQEALVTGAEGSNRREMLR